MHPRYYQSAANDAAWRFLAEQKGNCLIVLPTGAGKSLVIAMLCQQAVEFGGRVIVLQHRKELIQQNAEKIQILLPDIPVGIFSAGLNAKQTTQPILCAGIQSIWKKADQIGKRHLIVIDEAHLVTSDDETMYGTFLLDMERLNPKSRVTGLTATPFRTGEGPICGPAKLFRKICYEIQTGRLISEGFLCPITNKPAEASVNTDDIKIRGGEFLDQDMQRAFSDADNVRSACFEVKDKCHDRNSILIFAAGVSHAEQIAGVLEDITGGDHVGIVTGSTFPMERAETLRRFRAQQLRWLISIDCLTTGFDAPCIDAIAVMRATMSPGLFAQICGRGLRKHESKSDCLILDFGENIKRHGSLDDPNYGRASAAISAKHAKAAELNGRGKQCLNCGVDVAPRALECPECSFKFPVTHQGKSDSDGALTGEYKPEQWLVESVIWKRHTKKNDPDAPPSLRMDYNCKPLEGGLIPKTFSEWVCFEHENFARTKACLWWEQRSSAPVPDTVNEAIDLLNQNACRMPARIETIREGQYTRIRWCEFDDEIPTEDDRIVVQVNDDVEFSGFGEDVPF